MGGFDQEGFEKRREISDCFVLDMECLSPVAADKDEAANSKTTPLKMQRSLSRKGNQRGGERKSGEREATDSSSKGSFVEVCPDEHFVNLPLAGAIAVDPTTTMTRNTTMTITTPENRWRRIGKCSSNMSRRSLWNDPRRVLLFFAALSSMGTIILIYFTLSLSNMNGDGAQVQ